MQAGDNSSVKPAVKKKGGQGLLVLFILLLGVGGAGFGVGFTQKFVPVDVVGPDTAPGAKISSLVPAATTTPGNSTATTPAITTTTSGTAPATSSTTTSTATGTSSAAQTSLKKSYWIQTSGWDKVGYTVTVYINDQPVGNFDSIDRTEDVTKFVKPGENKVRFEAKVHPSEERNDFTGAFLTVTINQGQKSDKEFKDGQPVLEYKRKVTETTDYDDSMEFAAI